MIYDAIIIIFNNYNNINCYKQKTNVNKRRTRQFKWNHLKQRVDISFCFSVFLITVTVYYFVFIVQVSSLSMMKYYTDSYFIFYQFFFTVLFFWI
jgi:hypothetical protein